ncbi:MAG: GNAT family N-acetyltransferase [Blastocatellia bacterium]|nr:GNAT family N-acetyltransferase [Blastocatellia bacterium]
MFEWEANKRRIHIREAETQAEYRMVEEIQKTVWGFSDLDVVPAATLIATVHAGGILLCAFEGERMIGFVYGFPAYEHGIASIHSHMLAVLPEYRNLRAGLFLKLAQRRSALEKGINRVTWTFDPLQSLNANLNFVRLGVISNRYLVNFYGEASSSHLHQGFGTDRLWVVWLLDSDRVKERIDHSSQPGPHLPSIDTLTILVRNLEGTPELRDLAGNFSEDRCLIEIPQKISSVKERDPAAAIAWREATRAAFLTALEQGFTIEDFFQVKEESGPRCFYLLTR